MIAEKDIFICPEPRALTPTASITPRDSYPNSLSNHPRTKPTSSMTTSQAAYRAEQVVGHDNNAIIAQDVSNFANNTDAADPNGETMKALAWMGKNKVQIIEVPRPRIMEPRDVIVRITGSTVCGSDLHLLHGSIVQLEKGDILGHEFCGVVDEIGPEVQGLQKG